MSNATLRTGHCIKWLALSLMLAACLLLFLYMSGQSGISYLQNVPRFLSVTDACNSLEAKSLASSLVLKVQWSHNMVNFLRFTHPLPMILTEQLALHCINDTSRCAPVADLSFVTFVLPKMFWSCFETKINTTDSFSVLNRTDDHILLGTSFDANNTYLVSLLTETGDHWLISAWPELGLPAYAVLTDNLSSAEIDAGANLFFPRDVDFFLWQLVHSRLLTCRHDLAKKLRDQQPDIYRSPYLPDSTLHDLAKFRDVVYSIRVRAMLFGGTLLGWYRECGIIPDTTDFDTVALAEEYNRRLETIWKWNSAFSLYWMLGKPSDSLELSVYAGDNKIDMFFLYSESNMSWVGGMFVPRRTKLRWVYPLLEGSCSAVLGNHLFAVPCNVEAFLTADYGPNWHIPHHDANFTWYSSHYNVKENGQWSKAEWPYVYRTKFY